MRLATLARCRAIFGRRCRHMRMPRMKCYEWRRPLPLCPPGAERVGVRWGMPKRSSTPTSPSQRSALGPSLSPLKGGEGKEALVCRGLFARSCRRFGMKPGFLPFRICGADRAATAHCRGSPSARRTHYRRPGLLLFNAASILCSAGTETAGRSPRVGAKPRRGRERQVA